MTEQELRGLIAAHESDRVEFTLSTQDTDKFSRAVCAFANDYPNHRRPGFLIIGVDDNGRFGGLTLPDELLRNLGGLRDDGNIQPLPAITVEKVTTDEGEVAIVSVQPSTLPPVRYKGRVWIRIGPRQSVATDQEERALIERRISHARTFDAQPCLGCTLEDLSSRLFQIEYLPQAVAPEVIEENRRSLAQQLAALGFYDLRRDCPTNAGILLFGVQVRRTLPGAYVQFVRVDGNSLSDPILNAREIAGDLFTVLRELDGLVEALLVKVLVQESALRERQVEEYPRIAVRELLMNAVMHRDYASTSPIRFSWLTDRIVIQSPGGLYGEVTPENFPQQTSYRNPTIAEAMKLLGYVNRFGRGVLRAQEALRANGSPLAEFRFDAGFVQATIKRRP